MGRYLCKGVPTGTIIVIDIRDQVPESTVCEYFGAKATKSGWKYNSLTSLEEQASILSLYRRVYDCNDIPNKEISLQFARGLILMSRGESVNWALFREERRKVREGLKKKSEERREKREREQQEEGLLWPTNLGKKRFLPSRLSREDEPFPSSLCLAVKSEAVRDEHNQTMVAEKGVKGAGKARVGSVHSPCWTDEDFKGMGVIIQENNVMLNEFQDRLAETLASSVQIESKLRRTRILLTNREHMLDESRLQLRHLNSEVAALHVKDCFVLDPRTGALACNSEQALTDELMVKKNIEELSFKMSSNVVESLRLTIRSLEDELTTSESTKASWSARVLSLEAILKSMGEQLAKMHEGSGAVFFPRPISGNPPDSVITTHTLNPCPVCSLWFSSFNYLALSCGHTYHPYCLWELSRTAFSCAEPSCSMPFGKDTIIALGIRPQTKIGLTVQSKKATKQSAKEEAPSTKPQLSASMTLSESENKSTDPETMTFNSTSSSLALEKDVHISSQSSGTESPLSCLLCQRISATVILKDCGHNRICFACVEGKRNCPICAKIIVGWERSSTETELNVLVKSLGGPADVMFDPVIGRSGGPKKGSKKSRATDVNDTKDVPEFSSEGGKDYSGGEEEISEGLRHWCDDKVFSEGGLRSVVPTVSEVESEGIVHTMLHVAKTAVKQSLSAAIPLEVDEGATDPVTAVVYKKRSDGRAKKQSMYVDSLNHTRIVEKAMTELLQDTQKYEASIDHNRGRSATGDGSRRGRSVAILKKKSRPSLVVKASEEQASILKPVAVRQTGRVKTVSSRLVDL